VIDMYGRLKAMANTCESIVRIYGSVDSVQSFKTEHVSGDLSFVYFDDVLVDGESSCGAVLTDIDHQVTVPVGYAPYGASLTLYVNSRWNEPIDWFRAIVARHKDLSFDISWVQAADLFAGSFEGSDGLVTKHESRSGDTLTDDDYWEMGINRDDHYEPQFGQCGKCGDWVTLPCCNCISRELEGGK
jgi:hypothetical protein